MIASRKLYLFLAFAIIPFICSHWFNGLIKVGVALDLILLIFCVVDYALTARPPLLLCERDVSPRLSIGRKNKVVLKITNRGETALHCHVRDSASPLLSPDLDKFDIRLNAASTTFLRYELFPTKRGAYEFGDIYIRYKSFLGFFWRQKIAKASTAIEVYSDLKALTDLTIKLASSSELGELRQRKRGQGTDFASLREYADGDDPRRMDWKATARRNRPMVRTYEVEQEQRLFILIDAGRMMISELAHLTRFDHALNAALCLAIAGLTYNDQVGIGIFADKPLLYLPPHRGRTYLKNILEATASIEPRMVEPDYASMLAHFATLQKGRCLFTIITDLSDVSGSQSLLLGLANLSKRHLVFCVSLKDRRIEQLCQVEESSEEKTDQSHIFKRAVAIDLIAQRELAQGVLKKHGCLILDEAPEELSTKIVDRYLDVKRKNLL